MITFDKVSKIYSNNQPSLRHVNIHIAQGEMVLVTGHSGAGKSTFLKVIARLERISSGKVFVKNQDIDELTRKQLPFYRRKIGYVYQNHLLLQNQTVFENIALPLKIQEIDDKEIYRRVHAALERLGLANYQNAFPKHLSEGEQQRVGIARAVVHRPNILLADEPTGNLDAKLSIETMNIFKQFNQVGVTVLIATHDETIMSRTATRHIEFKKGVLIKDSKVHK